MGSEPKSGTLVRNAEGQFIAGTKANPVGRPKGAKNKITVLKMAAEAAWREKNTDRLQTILDQIVDDALDGDKGSRKMIFDAIISKAMVQEDKAAGHKQQITVHKMTVLPKDISTTDEED